MAMINNKFNGERFISLFELRVRMNSSYKKHYEDEVIREMCDFGKGTNDSTFLKAEVLDARHEMLIMAFFNGFYSDSPHELDKSLDKKKLGQHIEYWGNIDSRTGRKSYPEIRKHIFAALIAKTDIDLIALEKGELEASDVVTTLIDAMNEYANYGFYYLAEKLKDNPNSLYRNSGFLDIFLDLTRKKQPENEELEEL